MDPKIFNKRLLETFGSSLDGKALYRLVWSEDMYEKRKGDFERRTEGGLWLGRDTNVVQECRKYEYIKDRWILEIYTPQQKLNDQIASCDFYEPLFTFEDNKRRYLEPAWFALEYIVQRQRDMLAGNFQRRNEKMDLAEQEEVERKETQDYLDYLENESSDMQNQFRNQEAVIIHKGEN